MASSFGLSMFMQMLFLCAWLQPVSARNYSHLGAPRCHADEMSALLEFKASFTLKNESSSSLGRAKTLSWKSIRDCCSWEGIECDENTGRVIVLNLTSSFLFGSINETSSLFQLVHLEKLYLTDNDFNYSQIPSRVSEFSRMTHLHLSNSVFYGRVPSQIFKLKRLVSLNLCCNTDHASLLEMTPPGLCNLARNLTNLEELFLGDVNISSTVPECLENLTTLRSLDMESSNMYGVFPNSIFSLPKLRYLWVGYNIELMGYLPKFNSSSSLEELELSETSFSGELPASIGHLRALQILALESDTCNFTGFLPPSIGDLHSLTHLSFSGCKFLGSIPSSFGNLSKLEYLSVTNPFTTLSISSLPWVWKLNKLTALYLESMKLTGEIPSSIGNLSQLVKLSMTDNQLSGPLPPQITNLTKLIELDLSQNQLSGSIPSFLMNMKKLIVISLSYNQLQGQIPSSISQLQNLEVLALSQNNLSGTVELDSFFKLKELKILHLSFNRLSCLMTSTNAIVTQLRAIGLASCNLSEFPFFLQGQQMLDFLDLSDNNIKGEVPRWLWNSNFDSLQYMNLSHNFLTRLDGYRPIDPFHMYTMDLSCNLFEGQLPQAPSSILYYLVSNNKFTGDLPPWICNLTSAIKLDLSSNSLTGVLPNCLGNNSESLSALNLRRNKFHGRVPDLFVNAEQLTMIDLSHNQLEGKLPRSLTNCKMLVFIDFGNNQMNDTFPSWLGSLPELKILILQSNNFQGVIEGSNFSSMFPKLRILDLSHNLFTGKLPMEYFRCLNAMKAVASNLHNWTYLEESLQPSGFLMFTYYSKYDFSMTLIYKGIEMYFSKIPNVLTLLDLSSNSFEGNIPDIIGILKGLQGINLSNNFLIDQIPPSLGSISALESLDLSQNKLSGQIPEELTKLQFLSVLNVSFNNLIGRIPRGPQLDTFSDKSFEGNSGLCGEFISKKCQDPKGLQGPVLVEQDKDKRPQIEMDWKIILMGYASGLVIGVVLGDSFLLRRS